ncbi:MAG: mechanosensitive ion channel family protein [Archaeoglobaceae archaeon]
MVSLGEPLYYIGITPMQIIIVLVILVLGWIVIKLIVSAFKKSLKRIKLSEIIIDLLGTFFSALLYVMLILLALSTLGIVTGSVIIGLSAIIGLILGFGLQDTITNLASGIWIAALKLIDKGEFVEVSGETGTVSSVGIMATDLLTLDNKLITIPNKLIWNDTITIYNRMPIRRADVNVGVAYGTELDRAVQIAMDLMKDHPNVLSDPAPAVVILELGDSSINLQLRAWAKKDDWWNVFLDLTKEIYEAYEREGITIPFPQMDVHLKKE